MIREAKAENERKIVQEVKIDNEKCFQSVRAMRLVKESIRPLRHCKGNLLSENISKCNVCRGLILTKEGQGTDATGGHKFPRGGRRNMGKGGKCQADTGLPCDLRRLANSVRMGY